MKLFEINLWVFFGILFLFPLQCALAQDPLPGFTGSGGKAGLALSGRPISYSSPVIAEIDGNADNGKEIAVAGPDGLLYAVRADGSVLWTTQFPSYNCNDASSSNKTFSSPSVGEIKGDGVPYVVVGYGAVGTRGCGGGVIIVHGPTGNIAHHFSTKKFASKRYGTTSHTVFATPALGDATGNGKLEILFGSFDRSVFMLMNNGKPAWYYTAADTSWGSSAFYDINGNGKMNPIFATDISRNDAMNPPTPNGGYLYAFKDSGMKKNRVNCRGKGKKCKRRRKRARLLGTNFKKNQKFGFRGGPELFRTELNQTPYSSPLVGDLDPSNPGAEILIGSGCFFPIGSRSKTGRWVRMYDADSGRLLRSFRAAACSESSPAAGDIDGDGKFEVVNVIRGGSDIGGDGSSRLQAWDLENQNAKWSTIPRYNNTNDETPHFVSPIIADVDGNGSLEVLAAVGNGVGIFSGTDGSALSCDLRTCNDGRRKFGFGTTGRSTPAVGDINNDGVLDLVMGGAKNGKAAIYVWTNLDDVIDSPAGPHPAFSAPWPMFRGNANRSGAISNLD